MEKKDGVLIRLCILGLYVSFAAVLMIQCDATKTTHRHRNPKQMRNFNPRKLKFDTSNAGPYVSSPFSMPPFDSNPPYCVYPPPFSPQPSSTIPSPSEPTFPGPTQPNITPSPRFLPPVVVPPPPHRAPSTAMWCVAKAAVPEPITKEAMNYACGSGGDCDQIQPHGPCFEPDTVLAHASYAFNSYWQRTKVGGGTCDFGGTALLVTVDPSYDGCHFVYL